MIEKRAGLVWVEGIQSVPVASYQLRLLQDQQGLKKD